MLYLWWTKWHLGRFSSSTSVSPANLHSADCSTLIIYHPGAGTIRQLVADVPSGLCLTPTQEAKTKQLMHMFNLDLVATCKFAVLVTAHLCTPEVFLHAEV
jgi:hypothetical protein